MLEFNVTNEAWTVVNSMALIWGVGVGVSVTGTLTRMVTGENAVCVLISVTAFLAFHFVSVMVTVEGTIVEGTVLLAGLIGGLTVMFVYTVAVAVTVATLLAGRPWFG